MEETRNKEVRVVTKDSPEYPKRLKDLPRMPETLYVVGRLPSDEKPSMAVVGARQCSPYGRYYARAYARAAAKRGVQIISGMAEGIDTQGHKGALDAGTPTFAVLGNGPDICYPSGNRRLYQEILDQGGGIISEYPPGTRPRAYYFPARNRIISALSDLVFVAEAKEKSGSLITAGCALDQGKTVYALPGQVGDALSQGCNRLIFDGAGIAISPEILLEEWGILSTDREKTPRKKTLGLERDMELVYSCLNLRPQSLDELIQKTGFSPAQTGSVLTRLSLMGLAKETGRHFYVRQEA